MEVVIFFFLVVSCSVQFSIQSLIILVWIIVCKALVAS